MPSAVKKARGTYRRDRAAKNEVTPPVGAPGMPDWLDDEGRAIWSRTAPMLEELGVLSEMDRVALASYCSAASLAIQATRQCNREGLMKRAPKGSLFGPKVNPLIRVAQGARAQALRIGAEFGLTPAARTRVSAVPPHAKGDEAEEFIFGKPKLLRDPS